MQAHRRTKICSEARKENTREKEIRYIQRMNKITRPFFDELYKKL
jgi:hypothetical protein